MISYILFFAMLAVPIILYISLPKDKREKGTKSSSYSPRIHCESYIERRLYDALAFRGYAVSTQVPCGKYRIDLALIGPRIAIECDGKAYHSSKQQKEHDYRKNAYLRKNGWTVLRFSGRQINGNMAKVLQRIDSAVTKF